ncbi:hypothetical protein H0E86_00950 [Streptomyces sp. SCSIO-PteL053]|nr:hypothetical protein H0E86_00950 [Streptomyces sp. SCSIO-PteL053]
MQAAVWGLLRTAQSENPDRFVLVDVGVDGGEVSRAVLAAVVASGEPQVAVRGGEVLVPRLSGLLLLRSGRWVIWMVPARCW